MGYAAAVDQLLALEGELHASPGQPRRKFELAHMRAVLAALGDPHKQFRSVLVAGTNGKGSTSAMLAMMVASAGYRVGLYTSPHLVKVNERIQFPGEAGSQNIDDAVFARLAARVREVSDALMAEQVLPWLPSFFETVTAIAMLAFAESGVDLAVLEVGMGGRLDATNVVDPLFSVITDISLDHTEWLGLTIGLITKEKAGVLRAGGTMITLPQHPEANQALGEVAVALGVRGVNAADFMPVRRNEDAPETSSNDAARRGFAQGYSIEVLGKVLTVKPSLGGEHQHRNIALAIAAAVELSQSHGFNLGPACIQEGIEHTRWPGRLELISVEGEADVLFDVAHNAAGVWALRAAVSGLTPTDGRRAVPMRTLIFSCLADKAVEEMATVLFPIFDLVLLTQLASRRAVSMDRLIGAAKRAGANYLHFDHPEAALTAAQQATPADGMIVVAGSVFLVGQLRQMVA